MPAKNSRKSYTDDGFYHVYNRGVNKDPIYRDQLDYSTFLSYLKTYLLPKDKKRLMAILADPDATPKEKDRSLRDLGLKNFNGRLDLFAYCLMPNHFHFLVHQTKDRDMDDFMHSLMTRYTMYFNRRHGRVGSPLQGRYKALLVTSDEQLLYLTRYIHRNPLDLTGPGPTGPGLFQMQPSSYAVYLGMTKQEWVKPNEILAFFSGSKSGYNSYKSFVEDDHSNLEEKSLYVTEKLLFDE